MDDKLRFCPDKFLQKCNRMIFLHLAQMLLGHAVVTVSLSQRQHHDLHISLRHVLWCQNSCDVCGFWTFGMQGCHGKDTQGRRDCLTSSLHRSPDLFWNALKIPSLLQLHAPCASLFLPNSSLLCPRDFCLETDMDLLGVDPANEAEVQSYLFSVWLVIGPYWLLLYAHWIISQNIIQVLNSINVYKYCTFFHFGVNCLIPVNRIANSQAQCCYSLTRVKTWPLLKLWLNESNKTFAMIQRSYFWPFVVVPAPL